MKICINYDSHQFNLYTLNSDYLFKIALLGERGVGKSGTLLRFADDSFRFNYIPTIGRDNKSRTMIINNQAVKLQITDGIPSLFNKVHGIILMYDITRYFLALMDGYGNTQSHLL